MGPLWSMQPERNSRKRYLICILHLVHPTQFIIFIFHRLWPQDLSCPLQYSFELKDENGNIVGSTEVNRSFLSKGVERRDVKVGQVRGVLFLPASSQQRPSPAIITMFGGLNIGRVPEANAAMFASRGFVSLALAFHGKAYDMPEQYWNLNLDYFEEAVQALESFSEVKEGCIGMWGLSMGGNIALAMMAELPDVVRAATVVGATFTQPGGKIFYKGREVLTKTDNYIVREEGSDGNMVTLKWTTDDNVDPKKTIYFENSPADLLVIEGGQIQKLLSGI